MAAPNITTMKNAQDISKYISQYILDNLDVSYRLYDDEKTIVDTALTEGSAAAHSFMNENLRPTTSVAHVNVPIPPAPSFDNMQVDFDAAMRQVKGVVDGLSGSWLMQYFPAALPNGVEPLLAQVTSGTLISEAMQEVFWTRAKYQAQRDAARYEDEAVSTWASRGFSMPGGVVNKQIARKNQDLFSANADLAAQQAIKALEIQIDAVKFAADVSTKLRLGLISGLTGLVSAYAQLPTAASSYAAALANAKRESYAAIHEYYKTLIASSQLRVEVDKFNVENNLEYAKVQADFIVKYIGESISAAATAMNSVTSQAAAQISGLGNVSTIGIQAAA